MGAGPWEDFAPAAKVSGGPWDEFKTASAEPWKDFSPQENTDPAFLDPLDKAILSDNSPAGRAAKAAAELAGAPATLTGTEAEPPAPPPERVVPEPSARTVAALSPDQTDWLDRGNPYATAFVRGIINANGAKSSPLPDEPRIPGDVGSLAGGLLPLAAGPEGFLPGILAQVAANNYQEHDPKKLAINAAIGLSMGKLPGVLGKNVLERLATGGSIGYLYSTIPAITEELSKSGKIDPNNLPDLHAQVLGTLVGAAFGLAGNHNSEEVAQHLRDADVPEDEISKATAAAKTASTMAEKPRELPAPVPKPANEPAVSPDEFLGLPDLSSEDPAPAEASPAPQAPPSAAEVRQPQSGAGPTPEPVDHEARVRDFVSKLEKKDGPEKGAQAAEVPHNGTTYWSVGNEVFNNLRGWTVENSPNKATARQGNVLVINPKDAEAFRVKRANEDAPVPQSENLRRWGTYVKIWSAKDYPGTKPPPTLSGMADGLNARLRAASAVAENYGGTGALHALPEGVKTVDFNAEIDPDHGLSTDDLLTALANRGRNKGERTRQFEGAIRQHDPELNAHEQGQINEGMIADYEKASPEEKARIEDEYRSRYGSPVSPRPWEDLGLTGIGEDEIPFSRVSQRDMFGGEDAAKGGTKPKVEQGDMFAGQGDLLTGGKPRAEDAGLEGAPLAEKPAEEDQTSLFHRQSLTQSPEFKKWFGDSKVVDDKGEPLVVYHGTQGDFSKFDPEMADKGSLFGPGFYFTDNPKIAGGDPERLFDRTGKGYSQKGADAAPVPEAERPKWVAAIKGSDEYKKTMSGNYLTQSEKDWVDRALRAFETYGDVDYLESMSEQPYNIVYKKALHDGGYGPPIGSVMPVHIKLENPFKASAPINEESNAMMQKVGEITGHYPVMSPREYYGGWETNEKLYDAIVDYTGSKAKANALLQKIGYDGIEYDGGRHIRGGPPHKAYVVFDPTQIKSIHNRGTFDANDPNILFHRRLGTTVKKVADLARKGEIKPEEAVVRIEDAFKEHEDERKLVSNQKKGRARVRGSDWLAERLTRAQRIGEIHPETAEFGKWIIKKNPGLANDLGIGVRSPNPEHGKGVMGFYDPIQRVITLVKHQGDFDHVSAVHEILHHTERMMPDKVRAGIRREWAKQVIEAMRNADAPTAKYLRNVLDAAEGNKDAMHELNAQMRAGSFPGKLYHLLNPSEFWAVKGSGILKDRFRAETYYKRTWLAEAHQWLKEFIEKIKSVMGASSDNAVLKGLKNVLNGDGEFIQKRLLSGDRTPLFSREVSLVEDDPMLPKIPDPPKPPKDDLSGYISETPRQAPRKSDFLTAAERANTALGNEATPILKIDKIAEDVGNQKIPWNQKVQRFINMIHGSSSIASLYMEKYLKPIFKGSTEQNHELNQYLVAKRTDWLYENKVDDAPDLMGSDVSYKDAGISHEDAKATLKRIEARPDFKEIEAKAVQVWGYFHSLNKQKIRAGVWTKEQAKVFDKEPFYVKFNRDVGAAGRGGGSGAPARKPFASADRMVMRIHGTDTPIPIVSPLRSAVAATEETFREVAKAHLWNTIIERVTDKGLPEFKKWFKAVKVENPLMPKTEMADKGIVAVIHKGALQHWQVPVEVADAVNGLGAGAQPHPAWKLLTAPNTLFKRLATSWNVDFFPNNLTRDAGDAAQFAGATPVVTAVRGLMHYIKRDEVYQRSVKAGAHMESTSAGLVHHGIGDKAADIMYQNEPWLAARFGKARDPRAFRDDQKMQRYFEYARQSGKLFVHPMELLGEASEMMTRLGVFAEQIHAGKSDAEAAHIEREATLNFQRIGRLIKGPNQVIPFLNPGIQGVLRLARQIHEEPGVAARRAMLYAFAPAIITTAWNQQNPYYRQIPDREKETYWIVMLGTNTPHYIKLAKGQVQQMIVNPFQMAAESMWLGTSVATPGSLAKSALGTLSPVSGVSGIVPVPVKAVWEDASNWDSYWDKKIVTDPNLPASLQYNQGTSETMKIIGRAFSLSPQRMEHYLKSFAAGSSNNMLFMSDLIFAGKLPNSVDRVPVLRRFTSTAEGWKSDLEAERRDIMSRLSPRARAESMGKIKGRATWETQEGMQRLTEGFTKGLTEDNARLQIIDAAIAKTDSLIEAAKSK